MHEIKIDTRRSRSRRLRDTKRKVNLTGSVSVDKLRPHSPTGRSLTPPTHLPDWLPGLTVTNAGGNTPRHEAQTIRVRGQGTLNDAAPLVVVDGMTGIAISDVNPTGYRKYIHSPRMPASSAIYGSRAANGVILITTRQGMESHVQV